MFFIFCILPPQSLKFRPYTLKRAVSHVPGSLPIKKTGRARLFQFVRLLSAGIPPRYAENIHFPYAFTSPKIFFRLVMVLVMKNFMN